MDAGEPVLALADLRQRIRLILASRIVLQQLLERGVCLLDRLRVSIDRLGHLKMAHPMLVLRIGREHMHAVHIQEMLIFDDGFRVRFLLEECLGPFHDHVRIIVPFDGVRDEHLFICVAEDLPSR